MKSEKDEITLELLSKTALEMARLLAGNGRPINFLFPEDADCPSEEDRGRTTTLFKMAHSFLTQGSLRLMYEATERRERVKEFEALIGPKVKFGEAAARLIGRSGSKQSDYQQGALRRLLLNHPEYRHLIPLFEEHGVPESWIEPIRAFKGANGASKKRGSNRSKGTTKGKIQKRPLTP